MSYYLIDHTADISIRVVSPDLKTLFEEAAYAMISQITDTDALDAEAKKTIRVKGDDLPDLMVNWLREVLFLWTGMEMLMKYAEVMLLSEKELTAELRLESYNTQKHSINNEIKAVTYHQIDVRHESEGWETTIIFDV
jgi:SHS2 domain-containing protein